MGLNRDKFRKIVGGITTSEAEQSAKEEPLPAAEIETSPPATPTPSVSGQGGESTDRNGKADASDRTRFAKRGRPKGSKDAAPAGKGRKVKVSLFLHDALVNDLYEWAHADRIHPGEMFERALKPFHEREAKRRNAGKE